MPPLFQGNRDELDRAAHASRSKSRVDGSRRLHTEAIDEPAREAIARAEVRDDDWTIARFRFADEPTPPSKAPAETLGAARDDRSVALHRSEEQVRKKCRNAVELAFDASTDRRSKRGQAHRNRR